MGDREIREIGRFRSLGDSGDWEIREIGKFGSSRDWEFRGIRGAGKLEASGDWEIREIGENHHMWQELGTLSGRTPGKPTNWENRGLGDSEDWEIREIGRSGRSGISGD